MQFNQAEKEANQKGKIQWIDNNEENQSKLINYNHARSFNPVENGIATIKPIIKGAPKVEQKFHIKFQRIQVFPQNENRPSTKAQQTQGYQEDPMINYPQFSSGQPQTQSNIQTGLISKATTDDIQKLADALHNKIRGKKGLAQKREVSPGIKKQALLFRSNDQASLRFKVQQRNELNTQQNLQQQMSKSLKSEQQKQALLIARPATIKQYSSTMKVRNPYIKPPDQSKNSKVISSGGFKQENKSNRPNTAPSNHRNQSPGKSGTLGPNAVYGVSYGSTKKGKQKN